MHGALAGCLPLDEVAVIFLGLGSRALTRMSLRF